MQADKRHHACVVSRSQTQVTAFILTGSVSPGLPPLAVCPQLTAASLHHLEMWPHASLLYGRPSPNWKRLLMRDHRINGSRELLEITSSPSANFFLYAVRYYSEAFRPVNLTAVQTLTDH